MPTPFPQDPDLRIALPPPCGPEGLQSWQAILQRQQIEVASNEDLDDGVFYPVAALYLDVCAVRPKGCAASNVYLNNTARTAAFWLQRLFNDGGQSAPPAFEFEIRVGFGLGVSEPVFSGVYTPVSFQDKGLIVQVSGLLFNQVEFWARVPPGAGAGNVGVVLSAALDRLNNTPTYVLGNQTTGGPPVFIPVPP